MSNMKILSQPVLNIIKYLVQALIYPHHQYQSLNQKYCLYSATFPGPP
jgi:hypothetical protein